MPSIDRNLLPKLAYIGTEYAAPPFTGIVLRFPGLNQSSMKEDCDPAELEWGAAGTLLYSIKSRHRVAACMALCPVCDLPFHYAERPDPTRTMHHAFGSYGEIGALLVEHSSDN